jgi:hypothetical protein
VSGKLNVPLTTLPEKPAQPPPALVQLGAIKKSA